MAALFLHTYNPQPIVANLGPLTIHWYGLFLALAALAGYLVFRRSGRAYRINLPDLENLFFWTVLFGFIGARLYHVLNEWDFYAAHPQDIVRIWNGGLAIHGALIAGGVVFMLYSRKRKLSFWLLADIVAPALVLGQAIGRWGNYFNQELFGRPTNLPWGIPIETINRPLDYIGSTYFHPTFLYESLGSLLLFLLLLFLHRKRLQNQKNADFKKTAGIIFLTYLIADSLIRFGTELLRVDRVPQVFDVRLPLLVSIAIALGAAIVWLMMLRKERRA